MQICSTSLIPVLIKTSCRVRQIVYGVVKLVSTIFYIRRTNGLITFSLTNARLFAQANLSKQFNLKDVKRIINAGPCSGM